MEKTLYQRAKKGARATALAGLVALGLSGCADRSHNFLNKEIVGNYEFSRSLDGRGRIVNVIDTANSFRSVYGRDDNNDGRFDEIGFSAEVPKGSPLEAYANLDSLEAIWNRLAPKDTTQRGSQ